VASNPLQFAHETAKSSFLQSTLNRELGRNGGPHNERGLSSRVGVPNPGVDRPLRAGEAEVANKVATEPV
jgi:hypothetical protein